MLTGIYRAKLQEQNALSEEIVEAMNGISLGNPVDEQDLEDELEALQQAELDQKMLETGTVPADAIQRMPAVANGERKFSLDALAGWQAC
jgi:charged multivesicular body protein 4A/B